MENRIPVKIESDDSDLTARTPLGAKLLAISNAALAEGVRRLSAEEINREVRRRRGETDSDEADLR